MLILVDTGILLRLMERADPRILMLNDADFARCPTITALHSAAIRMPRQISAAILPRTQLFGFHNDSQLHLNPISEIRANLQTRSPAVAGFARIRATLPSSEDLSSCVRAKDFGGP